MARRGESSMNIEAVTLSLCRKEDERLLRQLLNKVKASADAVDVHEAESSKSVDIAALKVSAISWALIPVTCASGLQTRVHFEPTTTCKVA
jgi:hypothetical protein